jgi:hypothetical protein
MLGAQRAGRGRRRGARRRRGRSRLSPAHQRVLADAHAHGWPEPGGRRRCWSAVRVRSLAAHATHGRASTQRGCLRPGARRGPRGGQALRVQVRHHRRWPLGRVAGQVRVWLRLLRRGAAQPHCAGASRKSGRLRGAGRHGRLRAHGTVHAHLAHARHRNGQRPEADVHLPRAQAQPGGPGPGRQRARSLRAREQALRVQLVRSGAHAAGQGRRPAAPLLVRPGHPVRWGVPRAPSGRHAWRTPAPRP